MSNTGALSFKAKGNPAFAQTQVSSPLEFLRELANELSRGTVELPCFPDIVIRVKNALADPRTTAEQTVRIVGAEPRLAARLLQTANSAAFNTTGKPITDLRTAITRLGHQMVQSATMSFAVQQMQNEAVLKPIAKQMTALWKESIAVASIAQVLSRRTKLSPDQAFLTGLLYGIGRLYIMVRAVGQSAALNSDASCIEMISGWHPSIGKSVLENWGFSEDMAEAVGNQQDYERKIRHEADLTDIIVCSVIFAEALATPEPRAVDMQGVNSFRTLALKPEDCAATLTHAECQLGALHAALGV